ncbi:MAG: hypothetical protein ACNI3C_12140 [Candidatus Marinarcus sp.]|uniref:hypothetical protein n=1 Tax=Candidatus Marinarcus sp. TaxID=3100987 RepID=UPI003AFFC850
MDYINIILIILVLMAILLILFANPKKTQSKPTVVTKAEIIEKYKQQMRDLVVEHQNSKEHLTQKKSVLLKRINNELHNNIFFDDEEVKKIISDLASM